MTDERTKRVARNQAMYRHVNERLEDLNEALGVVSGQFRVVCECADLLCMEQMTVSRQAYERVRANPAQFIVSPGHEAVGVETVVGSHAEYLVVEKHVGEPANLAEKTHPRD